MSAQQIRELVAQMQEEARTLTIAGLWKVMNHLDQVIIREHRETGCTSELAYAAIQVYGDELQTRIYGVRPN